MTDVILLQASLDPTAVTVALQQIEKRVDQMVSHSDKRIKVMGTNLDTTLKTLRARLGELKAKDILENKEQKEFQKLQVDIIKTKNALEQLVAIEFKERGINLDTSKVEKAAKSFSEIDKAILEINEDALKNKLTRLVERGVPAVSNAAKIIRKDLEKAFKDPRASADELLAIMKRLEEQAGKIEGAEFAGRMVGGEAGSRAGGERGAVKARVTSILSEEQGKQLEQQVARLMKSTQDEVAEGAALIQAQLRDLFDVPPESERYKTEIARIKAELKGFEDVKPIDVIKADELRDLDQMNAKLAQFDKRVAEAADKVDDASGERLSGLQAEAQAQADLARTGQQTAAKSITSINKLNSKAADQVKAYKKIEDSVEDVGEEVDKLKPITDKLLDKKGQNEHKKFITETNFLLKSEQHEVRRISIELKKMGIAAKEAHKKGEKSAEEFLAEMKKLRGLARDTGKAFGEEVPRGTRKAKASLWKMGRAADSMGVRSAGSIFRITDALGGIGPAAVVGAVAIAGIAFALSKVLQVLIEVAKKAATLFFDFTKGSVESARAIEVVDRQLSGLLDAPEMGKAFRNLLLETSFDVGLNLTKNFAKVVVPLAKDLDEVERAAGIAASLAHAFQETDEAISNAIKQAAGGHFRPLIQRFGLTQREIKKIQDYQEAMGELTGTLKGLEEAIDRRGLNLENFRGSLQFLIGQFDVFREQLQITFGEPVRDALSEQLKKLFDLVDQRKEALLQFFRSLGESVGTVISTAGEIVEGILNNITDLDIAEFQVQIEDLGESTGDLLEDIGSLLGADDTSLVDTITKLVGLTDDLVTNLSTIATYLEGAKNILTLGGLGEKRLTFGVAGIDIDKSVNDIKDALQAAASGGNISKIFPDLAKLGLLLASGNVSGDNLVVLRDALLEVGENIPGIGNLLALIDELSEQSRDAAEAAGDLEEAQNSLDEAMGSGTGTEKAVNDLLLLRDALREMEQAEDAALIAQEEIDEKQDKLDTDRRMAEERVRTQFARNRIGQDIKRSQQREDLEARHIQRLTKMNEDYHFSREQSLLGFDRKEDDLNLKHSDKLLDIDRKTADKKIDIEQKFRDKLADMRAKFDLDAEEAIRRNDAVGLLRIRRRMQLELDQAETGRERDVRAADDSAEDKREDARIWLERGIRDNETAEQRKLDDLKAADEKQRQQIIDQYNWEFEQIDVRYQRERDKIIENEGYALEDMDKNFKARQEALDIALEAQYIAVKKWEDLKLEYTRTKLREATLLQQAYARVFLSEGSLTHFLDFGQDFAGLSTRLPQATGISGGSLIFSDDPYSPNNVVGFKQHGGIVTQGNRYGINERGFENFLATRSGIIMPREPFLMSPTASQGNTTIDNSRNINADMQLYDPSYVSPIQRAVTRELITEEYLKFGLLGT